MAPYTYQYRIFQKIVKTFPRLFTVKMPQPHLSAGSKQPPLFDGKLRLYSMEYCPYVHRVRLVLAAKNIPHEIVNINLANNKPEWYAKIHPEGRVPALDTGSEIVLESLVISDFLEEKYPQNPLYPKDPEAKKRDQELKEKIDPLVTLFLKCVFRPDKKSPKEWAREYAPHLQYFETELAKRGTFFGGDKPGMVDYMLWPWGERTPVVALALGQKTPLFGSDKFPLLKKWRKAMLVEPACIGLYYEPEIHWKCLQEKLNNPNPDYNNLKSRL